MRLAGLLALMTAGDARGQGGTLDFHFRAVADEKAATAGVWLAGARAAVTRCDLLLSGLELKMESGEWLESRDWFGFLSLGAGRTKAEASGLPTGRVTAIRFQVGLPEAVNEGDPARWEVGEVLHPEVNGLHWGWQGGYIFAAVEGHWWPQPADRAGVPGAAAPGAAAPGAAAPGAAAPGGFAFHYARSANQVEVELPVAFRSGGPVTLELELDVGTLLEGLDLAKGQTSTHSRPGDEIAERMKGRWAAAFRVGTVRYDRLQVTRPAVEAERPTGTTPFRLAVTQRFPQMPLPADNPLTEEAVALGEQLFHDARLSVNGTQSCASCHQQAAAFSDPRRFSVGAEGRVGKRQSMPLFNLAWAKNYFWDGRAATLREQVILPILDAHEMNETLPRVVAKLRADPLMVEGFGRAFGGAPIDEGTLAKALEQFLLTLVSQDSRFDQAVRKVAELTEAEKRGLQLFITEHDPARGLRGADCFHCHGGTLLTDHDFKNNGLALAAEDLGRMLVTGNEADRGKFKTPSLRNVALTAPYMHDGRFQTLEEVVAHYSSGVIRSDTLDPNLAKHPVEGLQLTAEEQSDLVAFLKTLTDETFTRSADGAFTAN